MEIERKVSLLDRIDNLLSHLQRHGPDKNHDDCFECQLVIDLKKIKAALAESEAKRGEAERLGSEADRYQALSAVIRTYSWLAEGRGSYSYDDPGYDKDVQEFVSELLKCLLAYSAQPYQAVLMERNRLKAERDSLQKRLEGVRAVYEKYKDNDRTNMFAALDDWWHAIKSACEDTASTPSGL